MKTATQTLLKTFAIILLCFTFVSCQTVPGNERVTLRLSDTTNLIGTKEYITGEHGRPYYAYRGIPYAEAPIGDKRWRESKVLELTQPEVDATKFGNICVQNLGAGLIGDENCLFVNVFTPVSNQGRSTNKALPVLFYIHGGGYIVGHGGAAGPQQLLQHDVLLVTFNYRLGVLGYLSSGSSNLPGNYGALDQITALDWVAKYIQHFGGDPNSVTIFGHSAGGGATHVLTMSPRAEGKYHRAVLQSGTALNSWVVDEHPEKYILDFAKRLNCEQEPTSPQLIKCLQDKTAAELLDAQQSSIDFFIQPLIWGHVVDGQSRGKDALLPQHPDALMEKGLYHSTPIMMGITADEGLFFYALFQGYIGNRFGDKQYFKEQVIPKAIHSILPFGTEDKVKTVAEQVYQQYFSGDESEEQKIDLVNQIYGDSMFNSGNWDTLTKYAKNKVNTVYSYIFTHRTLMSTTTIWRQLNGLRELGVNSKLFDTAVTHIDDMIYLFYPDSLLGFDPNYKLSKEDTKFAHYLTGILVAFAKNGDPAEGIATAEGFSEWTPIGGPEGINYYNLSSTPAGMGTEFRVQESKFWKKIYQGFRKRSVDEL